MPPFGKILNSRRRYKPFCERRSFNCESGERNFKANHFPYRRNRHRFGSSRGLHTLPACPRAAAQRIHRKDAGVRIQRIEHRSDLTVKVGDNVRIHVANAGGLGHEFMVVANKDDSIQMMKNISDKLVAQGLSKTDALEQFGKEHDQMMMMGMTAFSGAVVGLGPGENKAIEFVANQPGTYWYICLEAGATFPKTHAEIGMYAQFQVNP
jgi:uncharacterized cupredoxin-like copper-binding protein